MILDAISRAMSSAYRDISDCLGPGAARDQFQREHRWLELKLRRSYDTLLRQRNAIQSLTTWIAQAEQRTAALTQRVEVYLGVENRIKAWHHALELDQLRSSLERERGQLEQMRQSYHDQVVAISKLEDRRATVERHLLGSEAWRQASAR